MMMLCKRRLWHYLKWQGKSKKVKEEIDLALTLAFLHFPFAFLCGGDCIKM